MKFILLIAFSFISIQSYAKKCANFSTQKKLKLGMSSVKIQDKQVGKVWIETRMGEHVIACQVAMERTAPRKDNIDLRKRLIHLQFNMVSQLRK